MFKIRTLAVTGLTLAMIGGGTATALAATTPAPVATPTVTPVPVVTPSVTPSPVLRIPRIGQQDFDIILNSIGGVDQNEVLATGPVRFNLGSDTEFGVFRSRFADTLGNSVNVRHQALGGVAIDLRTCTITATQDDQPWFFAGGTGRYRFAAGTGLYSLRGIWSFPTRHFRCTLPRFLTVAQATRDLNRGGGGLPRPLADSITVQATGWSFNHPFFIRPLFPLVPGAVPSQNVTIDPAS